MQLIAIGYGDPETAEIAMDELDRVGPALLLRRDEAAAVVRDETGVFQIETHAVPTEERSSWTMLWLSLFTVLFFIPVFSMPVGAELRRVVRDVENANLDRDFVDRARRMVRPATSALFVLVERVTPDDVVSALEQFGGTVLQCEVSPEATVALQRAVNGAPAVA